MPETRLRLSLAPRLVYALHDLGNPPTFDTVDAAHDYARPLARRLQGQAIVVLVPVGKVIEVRIEQHMPNHAQAWLAGGVLLGRSEAR